MDSTNCPETRETLRTRVQAYLPRLRTREITNREVALQLGCNEQHLSRLLSDIGLEKDPAPDRKALSRASRERRAKIKSAATTLAPEEAAKEAGVSLRTIYRYRKK